MSTFSTGCAISWDLTGQAMGLRYNIKFVDKAAEATQESESPSTTVIIVGMQNLALNQP